MINKLAATPRNGAQAIITALGRENLETLAAKLGFTRKSQIAHLKAMVNGDAEPTGEELIQLCAVVSEGILRYDEKADEVVTDAVNALRAALLGHNLSLLQEPSRIALFALDNFRGGQDCLSREQLDELVLHLFPGMKVAHETNTLVARGYIQHPESSFEINSNPHLRILSPKTPPRPDPSLKSNAVPLPIGVCPPVAKGSPKIEGNAPILKAEKRADWLKRVSYPEKAAS